MNLRQYAAATTLGLALCALTGCGDDKAADDPAGTKDALTKPGTALSFGKKATLPVHGGDAVIELTVTGIERGTSSDLEVIEYDKADQQTPYYVQLEATVVSGDIGSYYQLAEDLTARSVDELIPSLAYSGTFAACQFKDLVNHPAAGTTVKSCATFLVDKGNPAIDSVQFGDGDAYDADDGTSVTWQ